MSENKVMDTPHSQVEAQKGNEAEATWVEITVALNSRRADEARKATEEQLRPQLEEQGLSADYVDSFCRAIKDLMRYFAGTGVQVTSEHLVSWIDGEESQALRAETWTREMGKAVAQAKGVAQSIEWPILTAID